MAHWPASFFFTMVGATSFFSISICRISESLSERIFGLASAAGLAALAFSARFDHISAPPRPAITTAAMSKRVRFIASLPPAPPHSQAGHHDQQREADDALVEQHRNLARVHVQRIVAGL